MFISSYFPLVPIFIVKDLNASTGRPDHPRLAVILIAVMSIACIVVIVAARSFKGGVKTEIARVSNKSADMFTYTIPYMISFYNFNLGDWKTLTCLSIFMSTMFLLSYKTNNFLVNPVLALAGYGLYDCQLKSESGLEWQSLVLSSEPLKVGDRPKLEQISAFLYLVTSQIGKEDNDGRSG